jgi:hypothetical protein
MRRVLLLGAALAAPACVRGSYTRIRTFQAPDDAALASLRPGASELGACLAALGAPLIVREDDDGAVLAWGWEQYTNWAATVSVPIDDQSLSFTYSDTDLRLHGVVGFFDDEWRLTQLREGQLRELLPERRARPQVVTE